jgi:protein-S-isoprenylcysteine O-methyltransferase Ste14
MVYHVPALIFAVILTAYWGRVVRLVYKMRRRHGASANFAPPEKLGRWLRIVWVPAVIIWVVHPWSSALVNPDRLPAGMWELWQNRPVGYVAAGVAALALAGTLICWKKMGKSWRMGINPEEKTQLIVSGPYAYVRHPIYALQSVLMLATMAAIASPLMIAVGVIVLVFLQWEAWREEAYLREHHGQAYAAYCRETGGFVPRSLRAYRTGAALGQDSPSDSRAESTAGGVGMTK